MTSQTGIRSDLSSLPDNVERPRGPRRRWRWVALALLVAMLAAGSVLWWLVLRHDPPASVDLDNALAGIEAVAPTTAPLPVPEPAAAATTVPASPAEGRWTIDRTITNAQGNGSFGGFRIDEVLVSLGSTTAVGRSPSVQGTLTVSATAVTAAQVSVDLTDITTNDSCRDSAVQRALATSRYPTATFVLTEPIAAGSVPADDQRNAVAATGDLTIRGVTRRVTVDLQAQLQGSVLVVVGSAPIALDDYGIPAPTAPVVASVADAGTFEFQLYFTRA